MSTTDSTDGARGATMRTTDVRPGTHCVTADIALCGTDVRRYLEVDPSTTLGELHDLVQGAMGWRDIHLHQWSLGGHDGPVWGPGWYAEELEAWDDKHDETEATVGEFAGTALYYEYDYGDSWLHVVEVGPLRPRTAGDVYPRLVAAAGTCPPEDSGGPRAYLINIAAMPWYYGWSELTPTEVLASAAAGVARVAERYV